MKRLLFASAFLLSATFGVQAEMLSLDSDFGARTITERLDSDATYSNFRLASYDEYNAMLSNVFPSIFTAEEFYLGRKSSPLVNIDEGRYFRLLFGDQSQIIMGKTSDGITMKWAGSNSWSTGRVGYTDIYSHPEGSLLNDNEIYGTYLQTAGWFLVSTGTANLTSGTFEAADVPTPFIALTGLGLLALGLRRKKH